LLSGGGGGAAGGEDLYGANTDIVKLTDANFHDKVRRYIHDDLCVFSHMTPIAS